ncbi:MAG: signal peptidase II [Actinobacteria bacterium]|nr:signal peptidase II [Actinomycetota bacterium]
MRLDKVPRSAIAFIVAGLSVLIDQVSKAAAVTWLSETERIPLLGNVLGLQLTFNPGAILSFASGATWMLTILGVGITIALFVAALRSRTVWGAAGLGFILGGAIGNVLDRLISPPGFGRGHVTDFLAYSDWFIGNLADVALAVGGIVLVVGYWMERRARARPEATPTMPSEAARTTSS